jgi:hypothetical protein
MPTMRFVAVAAAFLVGALAQTARAERSLSYADLVHRLTDLERLALLPESGDRCAQMVHATLYNPDVVPTEPISLGSHRLAAGDHKITVEILGANDAAIKAYMFGISHVELKPGR